MADRASRRDRPAAPRLPPGHSHPGNRFTTEQGIASVIDFMPVRNGMPDLVRIVETRPLSRTKRWRLAEILEVAK